MRCAALLSIAIVCAASGTAAAQPGQTPPAPPPGWAPPQPVYAAPGYHLLSAEERDLLAEGEISTEAYIGGGVVGSVFAFGLGHLVQGRFLDKGWIFMAGEAASLTIFMVGLSHCWGDAFDGADDTCDDYSAWLAVGLVGAVGFRIWELIDVWAGPPAHNARVRAARMRAGLPPYGLFTAPSLGGGDAGGVAGLTLRF